eukprot:7372326-Heterocapsa_arctica.AAC.1
MNASPNTAPEPNSSQDGVDEELAADRERIPDFFDMGGDDALNEDETMIGQTDGPIGDQSGCGLHGTM